MWWHEISAIDERLACEHRSTGHVDPTAVIEPGAVLDDRAGAIAIGPRTRVCAGAIIRGPVAIGADCMVGNQALLRGPLRLGDSVQIGFASEIKQALIGNRVTIGPMCFVADSRVDEAAYLGAMVRTSNQRLDRKSVSVREGGREIATGCEKLGCWIGAGSALGIQVIVLPGRVIAPGSIFEPRVTVSRNYPAGHYRAEQKIEAIPVTS